MIYSIFSNNIFWELTDKKKKIFGGPLNIFRKFEKMPLPEPAQCDIIKKRNRV